MSHGFTNTLHTIIMAGLDAIGDGIAIDGSDVRVDGDKILINNKVGVITITSVESSFMDDRRSAIAS